MDRRRGGSPAYARQRSGGSSSTGSFSPAMSPVHHHVRSASTGFSNVKRTQNVAAKAAAQRLAQVMASQTTDDDDDDEDNMGFRFNSSSNLVPNHISVVGSLRPTRSPSPALGRNFVEHAPSVRSTSAGRPSIFVRSTALVPPSRTSVRAPSAIAPIEPPTDRGRARRPGLHISGEGQKPTVWKKTLLKEY